MSRKDLSRTVIEGGRYYHNCFFRRASNGVERATTRDWLSRVEDDHDEAEASAPPQRPPVRKMFHDKLAPARRWLAAQVGRPWWKVYSELRARFDSRTVAGRHVVEDHMLDWVRYHHDERHIHGRFHLVVDRHGILRKRASSEISYRKQREAALEWAAGRVCALTYRGWWWFRIQHENSCPSGAICKRDHFLHNSARYHTQLFHSCGAMTAGEQRALARLSDHRQKELVIPSPWPAR